MPPQELLQKMQERYQRTKDLGYAAFMTLKEYWEDQIRMSSMPTPQEIDSLNRANAATNLLDNIPTPTLAKKRNEKKN